MARTSMNTVINALGEQYEYVSLAFIDNENDLKAFMKDKPDIAIMGRKRTIQLAREGTASELQKLSLTHYFEEANVNFLGSSAQAMALQLDKPVAKQKIIDSGLNSARYVVAYADQPAPVHSLRFPLFVKPVRGGGSKGVDEASIVHTEEALVAKVAFIHENFETDALIEEYLPGREFSVAVVRNQGSGTLRAMPIELLMPTDVRGNSFLSKSVKKADTERAVAISDPELKERVSSIAINSFLALGASDYGRIDVRLDSQGDPSFIEANLNPGLSMNGYLSRCFYLNEQINYQSMITTIVNLGLENVADRTRVTQLVAQ